LSVPLAVTAKPVDQSVGTSTQGATSRRESVHA
jgi:hypothetical protein